MAGLSVYDGILRPGGGLVTPQSSVDDMYRGIYPERASTPARTTPEGLSVRGVQTVAVDPFTGNPIHAGGTTAPATTAALTRDPGRLSASPDAVQRPPANYGAADLAYVDQGPKVIARTVNPDGTYSDPLTAINTVAPTTVSPFAGAHAVVAGRSPLPIKLGGTITEGDPWGGMRIGAPPAGHSGMVVGTPTPTVRSVIAARQSAPAAVQVISPEVHAALMAQQSPDQRGIEAARASGMIDQFGMLTGSGGHGDPAH